MDTLRKRALLLSAEIVIFFGHIFAMIAKTSKHLLTILAVGLLDELNDKANHQESNGNLAPFELLATAAKLRQNKNIRDQTYTLLKLSLHDHLMFLICSLINPDVNQRDIKDCYLIKVCGEC